MERAPLLEKPTSPLHFDSKTRIRLRALAGGTIDSGVNVLILFALAYVGTISLDVPLAILLIAVLLNGVFFFLIASSLTKRFADPAITWAQILAACGANMLTLLIAPQICYMFLVCLFVSLSFGSLYFNRRQFVTAWILLSMALGVVLTMVGDKPASPTLLP